MKDLSPKEYINDPALKIVLRDIFACIILSTQDPKTKTPEHIAKNCYDIADAMIKERGKIKL